jgi:hypothetical protein
LAGFRSLAIPTAALTPLWVQGRFLSTSETKAQVKGTQQFGLVAEEVEKADRDLVVRDSDGKPYTVRYDAVNAMLLNEFLKEHRKISALESGVAQLTARLKEEDSRIQQVSEQLEMSKPAPQTVRNSQ